MIFFHVAINHVSLHHIPPHLSIPSFQHLPNLHTAPSIRNHNSLLFLFNSVHSPRPSQQSLHLTLPLLPLGLHLSIPILPACLQKGTRSLLKSLSHLQILLQRLKDFHVRWPQSGFKRSHAKFKEKAGNDGDDQDEPPLCALAPSIVKSTPDIVFEIWCVNGT